jgi:hypothetical protein
MHLRIVEMRQDKLSHLLFTHSALDDFVRGRGSLTIEKMRTVASGLPQITLRASAARVNCKPIYSHYEK